MEIKKADFGGEKSDDTSGIWDDEETRCFYENLPDLSILAPGILLKKDGARKELAEAANAEKQDQVEDKFVDEDEALDDEKESPDDKEDGPADVTSSEPLDSNLLALENLLARLPNALNRESIDAIALDYCYLDNKASRRKLATALLGVAWNRVDLVPYYSRLIAILHPFLPDLSAQIIEEVNIAILQNIIFIILA